MVFSLSLSLNFNVILFTDTPAILVFPDDQVILENRTVTFLCFGTAIPPPTPSWTFKDNDIDFNDSRYSLGEVGLMFGSLTISNVEYTDRGEYTCQYTNDNGMDTTSAMLTVQGNSEPAYGIAPKLLFLFSQ